ncbi:hypothetical protein CRE_04192 [Caenorhabditis remanei]|uniref:F-box domain-containing protein n=1 Tax=Caenorhabditis remanei TaxID=31234 RepID=E3MYX9_CAERE|nr:hypothetical protein CRE_04192 [Caenorhabditis remanei]
MNEVSKPLPLFRLPAIPLTMISRYMDLQEILLISLASKKSGYIMRSLLPLNCFNLKLLFCTETKIVLGAKEPWDPVIVNGRKVGDHFKLQITQPSNVVSYQWIGSNMQESVELLLPHFATVFNPTISINFGEDCNQYFVMSVLKHVKQLNFMITSLTISPYISPENYKYILDEYKEISELCLSCETSLDFEYRAGLDFRVDDLYVSDGHWVHLEDFSNCKKVAVRNRCGKTNCCGKNKELKYANLEVPRALIRKWIESDCRLEHFTVSSFPLKFNFRLVLQGLGFRTIELNHSFHGVEITRRCDGKKATVICSEYEFVLEVID